MKIAEHGNPARRSWFDRQGLKLVAKPYLSGAFATQRLLERLTVKKMSLNELTDGYGGGIFDGPQSRRVYLTALEHSVPFVGSKDMMVADLSSLPRLSKADAESPALRYMELEPGMTMISRSGFNAGRRAYVRPDMAGFWSSEHVMKVVPDRSRIQPGYLYAFLASRFGEVLIRGGVYGSAVKHIAPEHVGAIPVPRFDGVVEKEIHELMEEAAALRAAFQSGVTEATRDLFDRAGLGDLLELRWHEKGRDLGFAQTGLDATTLRALNFQPRAREILRRLEEVEHVTLGEICAGGKLKTGARFKRVDADPAHGVRLVGQRQAFWVRPEGRWISLDEAPDDVMQQEETVLVAAHGTLGDNEVYGRSILVTGSWSAHAFSQDFLRVVSGYSDVPGAYLFAFLRSEPMFRVLRSMSVGGKQQEYHTKLIRELPVPLLADADRNRIVGIVRESYRRRDEADRKEDQALARLEEAVAQHAGVTSG
ncbi:restriction endonuclease subunit S [Streptomyces hygroscopicus]|uniref:methylation-associated defense system restriction endonuclease subunit S MAD5 n=1 Tax=Streptomyces hygroscopicus TaxID=1912 RepID=UPI00083567FF|nr:restriction endonuclease subunit S [Streptomyces hygroscopicus]GLV73264.1 type I restriction-modification system restriction endonuclease DNA specificity subunit HsdS [Streptomyces hygroscopicus subsp. hygroscopicus]